MSGRNSTDSDDLILNRNGIDDLLEVVMHDPLGGESDPFGGASLDNEVLTLDSSSDEDEPIVPVVELDEPEKNNKRKSPSPPPIAGPPKKIQKAIKKTSSAHKKAPTSFQKPPQSLAKSWPPPEKQKSLLPTKPSYTPAPKQTLPTKPKSDKPKSYSKQNEPKTVDYIDRNKRKTPLVPKQDLRADIAKRIHRHTQGQQLNNIADSTIIRKPSEIYQRIVNSKTTVLHQTGQESIIRKVTSDGRIEEFSIRFFDNEEDFYRFSVNNALASYYR
jgi:hypothetical protein